MTEHDPVALDVEAWADYWASLKVDVVLVSVTGILAFYQTKVPFHRKGKYLGTRDFFGDCFAAAKKRGLQVIARMSPDLNWEDATQAHPEWFQRDAQDRIVVHTEDARLFRTCMFSTYMTDYVPAMMKEVLGQYDVDGVYTNAWPPLGAIPRCACGVCRTLPPHGTLEHWEAFNRRTIELWRLYDGLAKAKKPSLFYFGNLGGGVRSTADLVSLGELADWFQCDNQGRGGDDTPIWGCAMQGRVCHAVQPDKMATNVTGAWSTGAPRWRNVHKAIPEARMWMNETVASGMVPYHHIIGGETGLGEDRRALEPARQFFAWHAQHERHFANRRSIASIGVVMGQRGQLFHTPPAGSTMPQYLNGLYLALLEGRFLFDFVHEAAADAGGARALLRRSCSRTWRWLSDAQCDALRAYVAARRLAAGHVPDQPVRRPGQGAAPTSASPTSSASARRARSSGPPATRYMGAHRGPAPDPRGLRADAADPRRRVSRAARARRRLGAHRGAGLRRVSARALLPRAGDRRPSRRWWRASAAGAARCSSPATSIARRGARGHHRPVAAAAERDPLGRGSGGAGDGRRAMASSSCSRGRREAGLAAPRPELHEPGHAQGLRSAQFYPIGPQRVRFIAAAVGEGRPASRCSRRARTCPSSARATR